MTGANGDARRVRVREAQPDDRPAVTALRSHLAYPSKGLLAPALAPGAGIDGGPVALLALAVPGGAPVGYALAVPGADAVTLAELVVAPGARRGGVGSTLVDAVADRFGSEDRRSLDGRGRSRDRTRIRVTTPADDDRARAFYTALGFVPVERRPDRYGPGRDAVAFERR